MRRCVFLLSSILVAPAIAAQQRLTPELLWQLTRVSDPQPSPDGKYLLYTVRNYELAADRGVSQLVLLALESGQRRVLTSVGSNTAGEWSADGRSLAFLSTRTGSSQIFTLSLDGGEAHQVTAVANGVDGFVWSPTGAHFAFTSHVQLDPTLRERHPDLPHADARVFDSLPVRHWDEWKSGSYSHLFVVAAAGGEPRDLMPGERFDTPVKPFGGIEQIAWSPDGRELCYTAKKVAGAAWAQSTNNDLYVVSVDGGPARNVTEGMAGYDQEPRYSPDGRWLAFHSMARAGFEADRVRLLLYDREGRTMRELTTGFDLVVQAAAWAPDSSALYFDADVEGTTQIYRVGLAGDPPARVSEGRFEFKGPTPSRDGRWVYALRQTTERPFEVVRLPVSGPSEGSPLTDENGAIFANLALPKVEQRWFEATDGKRIHAWVVLPPDFDASRKWPMLLFCQGGPQSQVGQWFSYRWNFHLMAAQGYVVLAVNRRGLPGFGQEWNDQISRDWGGQAMQDLLTATDHMVAQPYIDPKRVAAVGASFGGYSVYWLMGHDQNDRFCAMVAHCGVMNLESMYLSTEELWFVNWDLGGPYWQSPESRTGYEQFSPHRFVGNWDTPLLVIHGEKDFRVPAEQGIAAFTAAQVRGVPSRFLYFPGEGHWVMRPQNAVVWQREFFAWLDRYCKPEATPKAQPMAVATTERKYALERVDDTEIVQLYADGFELLDRRDKLLCYHLAQAAIAGRDIFLDQKFAANLELRDVLEELFVHRASLPADIRAEVERYTKLLWVHNGIHHALSTKKQLLRLSREQFAVAVDAAAAQGARLPSAARLDELFAVMTDPTTFVSCTNKSPGAGLDPLVASCNNLYVGVSSADLQQLAARYPLNSRIVKTTAGVVEQVYRAGDGAGVPPGLYARQLHAVIEHLEAARRCAPAPTAVALQHLIRYYRTGAAADWRDYNIAWLRDVDSVVDQVNGFVEVYLDARGQKGAWQGMVSFLDRGKTAAIERLAQEAQWFEDRMPWDPAFRKPSVKGISARAIAVIVETGDVGPITPIGVNLPNEADIRQDYGSKSVNLSNVVAAYEIVRSKSGVAAEFAWDAAEAARAAKWAAISGDIHTNLHEVIGHASGQVRPEVDNPARGLGEYYSTLEEARADLVGLYWLPEPRLRELGIVADAEAALAEYEAYARNALVQLRRVPLGEKVEEDHMRNRQMIIHWLIANNGGVVVEKRDGKTYYRVSSVDAFRAGCATLLAEVMRVKATADFAAGKDLVDRWGTAVDRALHEEVLARLQVIDPPAITGFVQPELRLVYGANGEVDDVEVWYPCDLADQMLRWSGRRP